MVGGGGFSEPADDIKSPPLDELHSLWVLLFLACPSSILSSPRPLYICRAFFQPSAPSATHTHTHTHTHAHTHTRTPFPLDGGDGVGGWWCLASALTGLSCMLHCLTNLHWSTVAGHTCSQIGHFGGCERGCVWVDVCPPTPRQTFCHRQHCTHQCWRKWLYQSENNEMVSFGGVKLLATFEFMLNKIAVYFHVLRRWSTDMFSLAILITTS